MRRPFLIAAIAAMAMAGAPALTQLIATVQLPGNFAPAMAICFGAVQQPVQCVDRLHPLPTLALAVQETLPLVVANQAVAPTTVFGGNYVYSQMCAAYGETSLEVRGPDGASWQTVVSAAQSDSAGGQMVQLGSSSVVRVEVAGTANCFATLSRVPA